MAIYAPMTRKARLRRTIALSVLVLVGAVVAPQAFATDDAATPAELDTYTVGAGESLWSIAANLTPEGRDVRDTMDEIVKLNALSSSQLQAGEQLVIPALG